MIKILLTTAKDEVRAIKSDKLVTIRIYADVFAANIDKSVLDTNDIKSMISADDCGGMRPAMQFGIGVRLIVREEDAVEAIKILNKSSENDDGEDRGKKVNSKAIAKPDDEDMENDGTDVDANPAVCPTCSYDNSMEMRENINWKKCRLCGTLLK
ncbi:MAG: hypothetical protein WCX65_17590 [bacterium]